MKTKRTSGQTLAGRPTHLSEPSRRFLRGLLVFMLALGSLIALSARGQSNYTAPYYFNTFAGNAYCGNGTGSQAIFDYPYATAVDGAGNVYVADTYNYTVRKITPAGVVTTLAGLAGEDGSADGTGSYARFSYLFGIAVDGAGNVYVTDFSNTIRKITPAGVVTTLAGTPGVHGSADATGSAAQFWQPWGIAVDSAGIVYVADQANSTIRKITPAGVVTTIAGAAGAFGNINGTGNAARFNSPYGVAATPTGIIYVADSGNHEIRKITPAKAVTTFAGSATTDGGGIGSSDGTGRIARFNYPNAVAVSGATVYVGDTYNHTIRKITSNGVVTTFAGTAGIPGSADGIGNAAQFYRPFGVAADKAGNVYVADASNSTIRKITSAGVVTTLAGTAGVIGSGDGSGNAAQFSSPRGIAIDGAKNLYVTDQNNQTIRKITPAGVVTTLGGVAGSYGIADGTGPSARFMNPAGIAVASSGTLYVADSYNHEIRNGVPADLKITCTDGKTTVPNLSSDTYTITVTNTGLENVSGAVVTDTFPAQVQSVTFTATGKGGATGFSNGGGNINQALNLPPNSSVTYKATGLINGTSGTVISNIANVSVPAGVSDPNTANNTAADKNTIQ